MNKNKLILKYKEHLEVLNRSSDTIAAYTYHMRVFLTSCDITNITDIKMINRKEIENYIYTLYAHKRADNNNPYCTDTICVKVRSIKRFFEFLEDANIIFLNPTASIKEPKKENHLVRDILTLEEVDALFDLPILGTLKGIRDQAIMEMFYSTGIRVEELCELTIYDADFKGQMLRINDGKGKKDRVVPMGKHAAVYLQKYITKARPQFIKENKSIQQLFVNIYGRAISRQAVRVMVKRYARAAQIDKRITPHTFRHTFATDLIRNGADLYAVQKLLGHADHRTTQRYIQSLGISLKAVHQKTHPRERDKEDINTIKPRIERIISRHESK